MQLQEFISQALKQVAGGTKEGGGKGPPVVVHFEVALIPLGKEVHVADTGYKEHSSALPKLTFAIEL
jgi:hypothetical protein